MLTVVGIGPGHSSLLTQGAKRAIEQAEILVGGKRHLALYGRENTEQRLLDGDIDGLLDWLAVQCHRRVVVLASGDPLLYGIGNRLVERFGIDGMQIEPGISAIQYLCARAGIPLNDLYMTSSHGRTPDFDRLLSYPRVAMVTDAIIGPRQIADAIVSRGLQRTLVIGENLSTAQERIQRLPADRVSYEPYPMNVVVILNEG